jgi:hypothetical protein
MKIILAILAFVVIEINANPAPLEDYEETGISTQKHHEVIDLNIETDQNPIQSKTSRVISNSLIATGTALGVSAVWFYGNHLLYSIGYYLAESNAPTSGFTYYLIGQQSYHLAGVTFANSPMPNAVLTAVGSVVGAAVGHITAKSFEKTTNFISSFFK